MSYLELSTIIYDIGLYDPFNIIYVSCVYNMYQVCYENNIIYIGIKRTLEYQNPEYFVSATFNLS